MTSKRWFLPLAGLVIAAAAAVAVTLVLTNSGEGDEAERGAGTSGDEVAERECSLVHNVEACEDGAWDEAGDGGAVASVCAPEAPDCDDMIVNPDGDTGASPEEPVSSGPITIIDDIDPNECNLVHDITACEEQATAAAIEDLAHNTGVDPATITVRSVEFVEWPDACLGVQNPKLVCAQVITAGFTIGLAIGERFYGYRTDATGSTLIGGK